MLLWRQALERHLREILGKKLELVWTQNRRLMISFRNRNGIPVLRLHESFSGADDELKKDLVHYLSHPRAKVPESINQFVRQINELQNGDKKPARLLRRGKTFDLRKVYKNLNSTYFGGKLKGEICWSRKIFGKDKVSIVLGSYYPEYNLIKIHPVLDTELVPLFYFESVVHHEMVHEYLHTLEPDDGGSRLHPSRFRELERKQKYYELALAWEKSHLAKLLKYEPGKNT